MTQDFTFEAWFYMMQTGQPLFSRSAGVGVHFEFFVGDIGDTSGFSTNFMKLSNGLDLQGTISIPVQEWVHLAFAYTHATKQTTLFFNGVADVTGTFTPGAIGAGPTKLGSNIGNNFYNGQIDEARLWHEARTEAQISAFMGETLEGYEDNLVFNHDFQKWTAGNVECVDRTPNGHNLIHSLFVLRTNFVPIVPILKAHECASNCFGVGFCSCSACACIDSGDTTFDCAQSGGGG